MRCFGFFPMSRYLVIDAEPSKSGIIDGVAHRSEHAPVYRTYSYADHDALYEEKLEDHILLLLGRFGLPPLILVTPERTARFQVDTADECLKSP